VSKEGFGGPKLSIAAVAAIVLFPALLPSSALAHFQMLYLGGSARMPGGSLQALLLFTHPYTGGPTMEMGTPEAFYVVHQRGEEGEAEKTDLLPTLEPIQWKGVENEAAAYIASIPAAQVRSMGDYIFVLEPSPYYEASEDKYIQQFTKTVINLGGVPGNWDQAIGLPAEILPLNKPYANWKGGVFRGVVLSNGKPVPFAEIEVEYVNRKPDLATKTWSGDPALEAPTPSLEVLSIRADESGTFAVGLPKAGWWGVGALDVGPRKRHEGKPLSQDAVIWVEVTDVN